MSEKSVVVVIGGEEMTVPVSREGLRALLLREREALGALESSLTAAVDAVGAVGAVKAATVGEWRQYRCRVTRAVDAAQDVGRASDVLDAVRGALFAVRESLRELGFPDPELLEAELLAELEEGDELPVSERPTPSEDGEFPVRIGQ